MKYTTDEMISALEVIRDVCGEQTDLHDSCGHCPFWLESEERCGIEFGDPDQWDIVKPTGKLLK